MPREDKVAILKESLAAIGKRIEYVLQQKAASGEDRERWKRHLWTYVLIQSRLFYLFTDVRGRFVTLFWPKKVKAAKLEEIHAKMITKEGPRAPSADGAAASKKPRLSSGASAGAGSVSGSAAGGGGRAGAPSASAVHTNGKHR